MILVGFFVLFFTNTYCQSWNFLQKVVQPKRSANDVFGQHVVLEANYAIIGCWRDDYDQNGRNYIEDAGAAYLYQKSEEGIWSLAKKIVASDRTLYDGFGYGLKTDGDKVVIGAPFEGAGLVESAGAIYVFENRGGALTEVKKLFAPDREYLDEFGSKVAISGDWIIVGSPRDSEDENGANAIGGAGSAYLFKRTGNDWNFAQKIVAFDRDDENDRFGFSVAINGDYAVVGASGDRDSGSVYIFKNGGGGWTEIQKLTVSTDRGFGGGLAMEGNRLVVGSGGLNNSNGNTSTGAAYIFENTDGVWTEVQRIEPSDGRFLDAFGFTIDLEGDYMVVGSSNNDYDENNEIEVLI